MTEEKKNERRMQIKHDREVQGQVEEMTEGKERKEHFKMLER